MDNKTFQDRLAKAQNPVVIDLWASWCMPCKMIEPSLHNLEKQYKGQVEVWKINADESQGVLRSLGVMGIPTLVAFRDGKEVTRVVGAQPQSSLDRLFQAAIAGQPVQKTGLASGERYLRLFLGLLIAGLGWFLLHSFLLVGLGAIVLFSAVYDRCPIYQAIAPRIGAALRNLVSKTSSST